MVADVTGSMQESHWIGMTIFDAEPSGVSPPYCYKGDYGGLVLPAAYYEIDFKIRGDEDMFVSKSGELYDESNPNFNNKTNLATDKVQRTNDCFVHISYDIFAQAFSNNKIMIEWGNDSPLGNVDFKGTVVNSLPSAPKHGWLVYLVAPDGMDGFYIYDGTVKRWRKWEDSTQNVIG